MHSRLSPKKLINILIESYPRLSEIVPEIDLPVMKKSSVQIKFGGTLLGEGHYGIVINSNDPNKIVKITTDVSEATFASTYIEKNWIDDPDMIGIARYYHCFNIGKIYTKYFNNKKEIDVFFISREVSQESEKPVSKIDTRTTSKLFESRKRTVYKYLEKEMLTMDEQEVIKRLKEIKKTRSTKDVLELIDLANKTSKIMDSLSVEETYESYISLKNLIDRYNIYICDLHHNNFRMVHRKINNKTKLTNVVSDTGHMFVMPWSDIVNPKTI